ncbi:uncharacterized protein LY79DRAFT_340635 [Colletotrichum navitas]|uniref:Uncharacterized protein n=1 Tax=Colletotrichum navitas TaxID=681940 RepID=A0AAD8PRX1_9PEZI|nr:uncharacterized protein LY79DRAFT_340635 [Colletotrichum navitas]KAK1579521.1 hypothetical protein LY79DRAFT_340635 [Colletotrichum navitas]
MRSPCTHIYAQFFIFPTSFPVHLRVFVPLPQSSHPLIVCSLLAMRHRKLPIILPSYQVYAIHRGSPCPARPAGQSLSFAAATVPPHSTHRIAPRQHRPAHPKNTSLSLSSASSPVATSTTGLSTHAALEMAFALRTCLCCAMLLSLVMRQPRLTGLVTNPHTNFGFRASLSFALVTA